MTSNGFKSEPAENNGFDPNSFIKNETVDPMDTAPPTQNIQRMSLPCVLRVNDELTLLQYQGRPQRRQLNPHEVKVKPESKMMEVKEMIASSGSNYDPERADQLAISIDGQDDSARDRYFPSKKFDHIRLKGQEMATRGTYFAAIVRNGKLILFPVSSTYQLRPQLGYMERAAQKSNALKNAESTDEEEEVKAVNVKVIAYY